MAGERAVTAAQLGENGFRGSELGLEGVQGFAATFYNGRIDPDALLGGLGDSYAITQRWTKAYPMNLTLHAPVEALLSIMRTHDLDFHDIDQIDAAWQKVEPFLGKHIIHSVVSAQASLPFALSVAAVRGKVTVDEFTDETLADPDVRAMIPRTTVHHDQELYKSVVNSQPGRVTVRLKDGREFTAEVLYPKGNPSNRMTEEEFRGKFTNMVDRVLGPEQSGELYDRVRALPDVADVADVATWFSPRRR
jgi:2-methylcitrate dehydratase PrpD